MLVVIGIMSTLSILAMGGWKVYRGLATGAVCSTSLKQLAAATGLYCSDHNGDFPPYVQKGPSGGRLWYFGLENSSAGAGEGSRDLDRSQGVLYPYIQEVGKIEVCPGFNYGSALWKPKFKGASYGYGYNWLLGGRLTAVPANVGSLSSGARVVLFGDCGQVNNFQPPASASKPMIEEFYIINETDKTVHFRHGGRANMGFVDGHVESMKPAKGTEDRRIPGELVGRITPRGSLDYLR